MIFKNYDDERRHGNDSFLNSLGISISMLEKIKAKARERLAKNDYAHDYSHATRVENLVNLIHQHEGGDKLVLSSSSYLHDWCTYGGREYHVSEAALAEIRGDLRIFQFPEDKIELVVDVVRHHEDYDFREKGAKLPKECRIFQDADRLDALGAIGIARCFYTSASLGNPLGTPDDMHPLDEHYHVGQLTSSIQHFYTKLLHLKDMMNTEYAKKLAQGRHDFLSEFLRRFKLEWDGKI